MSKGSRQNGFVPLVKRLALGMRYFGLGRKHAVDGKGSGGLLVFSENIESLFLTIRYVDLSKQGGGLRSRLPNGVYKSSTGNLWIRRNPTV